MRLICPNCGAQYEVAEDAIPDSGRDVQCSNCGHTWFEKPGASVEAESPLASPESDTESADQIQSDTAREAEEPQHDETEEHVEALAEADDVPSHETHDDAPADTDEDIAGEQDPFEQEPVEETADDAGQTTDEPAQYADEDDQPNVAPSPRHELEDSVADILREEAAREQAARAEESTVETQTDMPLDPPEDSRASESRDRLARLKGEEEEKNVAAVAAMAAASRKEMLPDIEEINSSLRTNAERGEAVDPSPEEVEATNRKGFRWGFWGILLLILLAVLIYLFADQIVAALPQAEGPVMSYVNLIDQGRLWINGMAEGALGSLEGDTSPESN